MYILHFGNDSNDYNCKVAMLQTKRRLSDLQIYLYIGILIKVSVLFPKQNFIIFYMKESY